MRKSYAKFCVEGSKYSEDGESSVARSVYSIAQNPVYTFYNPKHADLKTAWGTRGYDGNEILADSTGRCFR